MKKRRLFSSPPLIASRPRKLDQKLSGGFEKLGQLMLKSMLMQIMKQLLSSYLCVATCLEDDHSLFYVVLSSFTIHYSPFAAIIILPPTSLVLKSRAKEERLKQQIFD